ncbi:MAG: hypothetical protein ACRD02_10850 [Acidimicrobiia bacterium]
MTWLLALLASITLSPPFGEATASARPLPEGRLEIEIEIEVDGRPTTVVAHLMNPGGEARAVALAPRGPGRFGGMAEIDPVNLAVVFEALYLHGVSELSEATTLQAMGVDFEALRPSLPAQTSGRGLSPATKQWGWAGVAFGAVALALLALWTVGEPSEE